MPWHEDMEVALSLLLAPGKTISNTVVGVDWCNSHHQWRPKYCNQWEGDKSHKNHDA